jgi:hypothetical protein
MIAKHKALNEMMDEPESSDFKNNPDFLNYISDKLNNAMEMQDWDLVKEVCSDIEQNNGDSNYEEDENGIEDMPGFEGTMSDLDNLSIRENEISLNEGQLLLRKIYNQHNKNLKPLVEQMLPSKGTQTAPTYWIDKNTIYSPTSSVVGGEGYKTPDGKDVWLNKAGSKSWPKGSSSNAKTAVDSLYNGIIGSTAPGGDVNFIENAANMWTSFDLPTQNEFLKLWYVKTNGKNLGTPWKALLDKKSGGVASKMIVDSKSKVNNFCKSYVNNLNLRNSQMGENPICDGFLGYNRSSK